MNLCDTFKYVFTVVFAFCLFTAGSISFLTPSFTADTSAHTVAHAQEDTTYTFMQNVNLPGFGGESDTINISEQSLAEFVNTLIQITIGFAILLAIIMVIAAGVEYMTSGSVDNKDQAKERIGKAIGGLFLALSAVVILQTINPNLIELDAFEKVNVEGEEIVSPDFEEMGVTDNPDDTGLYYCFSHDSWSANDYACAETQSQCEDAKGVDDNSYSECRRVVYYNGAYSDENLESTGAKCYATDSGGGDPSNNPYGVSCHLSLSDCNDSREQSNSIPETPEPVTECKSPNQFGSEEEEFSEEEINLFQNEVLANEDDVRNFLSNAGNGGININKDKCENIGDTNCTNVGGIGDNAKNALAAIDNQCDSCNGINGSSEAITVTGGTEWWLHSEGTEHKPGVGNPSVDLRVTEPLNTFIDVQGVPASDDDPCANFGVEVFYISSGDMAGCYHHEVSPTHWHVEFQ